MNRRRRKMVSREQRRRDALALRARLRRVEPDGEPAPFRTLDALLNRCFPEIERATTEEKAAWSRTFLDESQPITERLAAGRRLGESLGAFDGADPDEVAE